MSFKHRLKEARLATEMSQDKVAQTLGVTRQAVSNWENPNSPSTPDPETIAALAKLYNVSADYLLGVPNRNDADHSANPNLSIERQIVRSAAESGDLLGWSEEQIRRLETHIRIAKEAILAEEEEKKRSKKRS